MLLGQTLASLFVSTQHQSLMKSLARECKDGSFNVRYFMSTRMNMRKVACFLRAFEHDLAGSVDGE